jgi:hypothetical protein
MGQPRSTCTAPTSHRNKPCPQWCSLWSGIRRSKTCAPHRSHCSRRSAHVLSCFAAWRSGTHVWDAFGGKQSLVKSGFHFIRCKRLKPGGAFKRYGATGFDVCTGTLHQQCKGQKCTPTVARAAPLAAVRADQRAVLAFRLVDLRDVSAVQVAYERKRLETSFSLSWFQGLKPGAFTLWVDWIQLAQPHHEPPLGHEAAETRGVLGVAVQVESLKAGLKLGFHFIGARVGNQALSGAMGQLHSTCTVPTSVSSRPHVTASSSHVPLCGTNSLLLPRRRVAVQVAFASTF